MAVLKGGSLFDDPIKGIGDSFFNEHGDTRQCRLDLADKQIGRCLFGVEIGKSS